MEEKGIEDPAMDRDSYLWIIQYLCKAQNDKLIREIDRTLWSQSDTHKGKAKIGIRKFDPDIYLEWEKKIDLLYGYLNPDKEVRVALTGLNGYALDWWDEIAKPRRHTGEPKISSGFEMFIMKKWFVSMSYGQIDSERLHSQSNSARVRPRLARDEQKVCYGHAEQRCDQVFGQAGFSDPRCGIRRQDALSYFHKGSR